MKGVWTQSPLLWLLPGALSALLIIGYAVADLSYTEQVSPFLKGIGALEHFIVHWSAGIFFALLVLTTYKKRTKKIIFEPLVFFFSILVSHWPDIRFILRGATHGHDWWEAIFLLHTIVDESRAWIAILVPLSIVLGIYYYKIRGER